MYDRKGMPISAPRRRGLTQIPNLPRQTVMAVLAQDELGEVEKIKYFVEPDTHFVRFVILYSNVSSSVEIFRGRENNKYREQRRGKSWTLILNYLGLFYISDNLLQELGTGDERVWRRLFIVNCVKNN